MQTSVGNIPSGPHIHLKPSLGPFSPFFTVSSEHLKRIDLTLSTAVDADEAKKSECWAKEESVHSKCKQMSKARP